MKEPNLISRDTDEEKDKPLTLHTTEPLEPINLNEVNARGYRTFSLLRPAINLQKDDDSVGNSISRDRDLHC